MAEKYCSTATCREVPWPHEAVTNRLVADLTGQSVAIDVAVREALWPDLGCTRCLHRPNGLQESGRDADWTLASCDHDPVRLAEHKPLGAAGQWSWATTADYRSAVADGIIRPLPSWKIPGARHERPHRWSADCSCCKSVHRTGGRTARLAIPQVVRYAVRHHVPCTLVTDLGDASAVYITEPCFTISDVWVPVRTVPDVLDHLALRLAEDRLATGMQSAVRRVATRMWRRSPWPSWEAPHPGTNLVSDAALRCAEQH